LHANFTFCFSYWGLRPQTLYIPGLLPWTPTGGLPSQTPWPGPHYVNPLNCKILGTPMHAHSTRFAEPRMSTRHQCEASTWRHKAHFAAVVMQQLLPLPFPTPLKGKKSWSLNTMVRADFRPEAGLTLFLRIRTKEIAKT